MISTLESSTPKFCRFKKGNGQKRVGSRLHHLQISGLLKRENNYEWGDLLYYFGNLVTSEELQSDNVYCIIKYFSYFNFLGKLGSYPPTYIFD